MPAAPAQDVLCADPRIARFDELIGADDCVELVELARPRLASAAVSGDEGRVMSPGRTAQTAWFGHETHDVVHRIVSRIAGVAGLMAAFAESLQVARYGPGGEYRPHFDAYDLETPRGQRFTAERGQRLVTGLLYLNSVEAGGATVFPRLELEIQPARGRMLLFENCSSEDATKPHPKSLHGSSPVVEGEKWIANLWFRERVRAPM